MLFVVLLGTLTKDMGILKIAKSSYSLNDGSDKEESKDDNTDGKEVSGKEMADKLHFYHCDFTFMTHLYSTLFSSVAAQSTGIENPYLESISLPPEVLA